MRVTTVLLIEDEDVIADIVHALLEDEGYQVVRAADGTTGLARVAEVQPDVVLCDVMLPGIDGRDVCRRLEADPQYRAIPRIMMSAAGPPRDCVYAAFLGKPFDIDILLATIIRVVGPPTAA